jgi:hypothetical protein
VTTGLAYQSTAIFTTKPTMSRIRPRMITEISC